MARNFLRLPAVKAKTGYGRSTIYEKIAQGKFPKPTRLDPDGRAVGWFEDQIDDLQERAVARADTKAAAVVAKVDA